MILLSERQKKILQKLSMYSEGVTMAMIEDSLVISKRTVYREFSELKLYLVGHGLSIESTEGRYFLVGSKENLDALQVEMNSQNAGIELTSKQRQSAVVCLLLLSIEPMKIFNLAVSLGVSENTIQRDLRTLTFALSEYGIDINARKAVGVQVIGDEAQKRLILCGILTNEINEYEFFEYLDGKINKETESFFLRLLPKELLVECSLALKDVITQFNMKSDMQEVQLVLLFAISMFRMSNEVIKSYSAAKQQDIFKYRQKVLTVLDKLGTEIKEKITTGEIDFLAVQLKGLDYHIFDKNWSDDNSLQVSYDVKELIKLVSKKFDWNFEYDHDLFERLSKHIMLLLTNEMLKLPNTKIETLENISKEYGELYKVICDSLTIVFSDFIFSPTEAQLILLYFANSYASESGLKKMATLIVCPNGIGTASILKMRLHKEIPEINLIKIAKASELNEVEPARYDLILSTVNLPGFNWNYIVVSPLLLDDEIQQIKTRILKLYEQRKYANEQNKKEAEFSIDSGKKKLEMMAQKMSEANQIIDAIKVTKVTNAGGITESLDFVLSMVPQIVMGNKDKVKIELLKRIQLAPVGIPRASMALVHTTEMSVKKPFLGVYDLVNEIEMLAMDQAPIRVGRIILMLGPVPMTDFQNILMGTISGAIVMNNTTMNIFEHGSGKQIRDLIATRVLEQFEFKGK